ncbi:DUF4179 domain-containing protein [Paenibacillus cucumis (ex Kampfer et al. 2016)]|uniref:DUF4179 domain-containing protein n=1 Tax=Paenibacillus cucumis (ex Kampfer et al. 2016) TaxID=1776858 RepID=A0ABS7KE97_9BACL|nr:DUF4179 domain-containing protein [Paenibacillus cucumis (ex Kampfer et al. 2016)]MBY0202473.1 DUF4179 domain-containing protein [Paenibacillus cucumis (ex Kampfer et al. 2016)]
MTDEQNPFEALETRLQARKAEYDTMPVPDTATSRAVQAGIQQASRKRKTRLRWLTSSISAAALILLFTGCIRVSPAFASFVEQLPGMEGVVNLIRQDKGLMMAIDQSLLQKVGITDEHNGGSVTVEGIITDDSRMVIFYKMKGMKNTEKFDYDIDLLDVNGKDLPVGFGYSTIHFDSDDPVYENYIDVIFTDQAPPPDVLTVVFKSRDKANPGVWKVTMPVDKNLTKGMKEVIPVNETLVVDGQRIQVKQATMYPTRLVLDVQIDPNNSKKIFGLSDLQLVDEQGRAWRTDTAIGEDTRSIYFESMYFSKPKKLTLQGSGFSGLDKKELDFSLDLKTREITGGPSGLQMLGSKVEGKNLIVDFSVPDSMEDSFVLAFSKVKDSTGKTYQTPGASWSPGYGKDQDHTTVSITIEHGAKLQGQLQMKIATYPSKVKSPFSLEIPVNP